MFTKSKKIKRLVLILGVLTVLLLATKVHVFLKPGKYVTLPNQSLTRFSSSLRGENLSVKAMESNRTVPGTVLNSETPRDNEEECACALTTASFNKTDTFDSDGCKLPHVDPFSPEIMKVAIPEKPLRCPGRMFTEYENNVLKLLVDVKEEHQVLKVVAEPIHRVSDHNTVLGEKGFINMTRREAKFHDDFLKVTVHFQNGTKQTDFHASISENAEVAQRNVKHSSPLNVMMLVLDGTSAAHFQRMLPKSYDFLKDDMESHFFKGYSIVGESTTNAMSALLTAKTIHQNNLIKDGTRGHENAGFIDEWPFIFKDLKKLEFATMWSEDQPALGAFHLRLMGFSEQPVDHYGRTLWLNAHGLCLSSQPLYELQLKYLKSFMKSYPVQRKFGLTFLSDLCHREPNLVSSADDGIVSFLNAIKSEKLLNDTMFIVMADHGGRFGELRRTSQGKLEHRLPFLSVTFPSWFKTKYPRHIAGFVSNTRIITSPFDLYTTFKHLLTFPEEPVSGLHAVGQSLFVPLPENRTCSDAGIPEQYCPCLNWESIDISHTHAYKATLAAVGRINEVLTSHAVTSDLCHTLELKTLHGAYQKIPSKQDHQNHLLNAEANKCTYQVKFQTTPGDGVFEAIVRLNNSDNFEVYGDVDRVSMYGDQPKCIASTVPSSRPYCLCK